ncbi:hypothetical protein C0214_10975 [Methylobacterium sp. DM1]|jgi:hypothetical protein|uniref:Uncharacterized protein n=1 Tax=Methylorubrum populi (strain ATCC BAA-705 / NCIMB 13946 / BJ001) TaxID=441620 RepID=B1ZJD1_METPB|nr:MULTISPECIES: hypothetical protein [Methylorubrum]ACB80036.1 hypothetical protein Mpop_1873 [Methylorubrum populi BJ001]AWI88728.1 hypothetical protein C0214_10975 [Methylobacterium sp. DM1]MBI1691957.1 hypothetical protein [Methylorubrum sp. DB1722]
MLDLALALVWTVPGVAALAAAAAAVLAFLYLPRLAVPLACLAVVLAGVAYVDRLGRELATARAEAAAAKADAAAKGRAIEALEADAAESVARAKAAAAAHARIRRAPASADGPVAPVLREALEGLRR